MQVHSTTMCILLMKHKGVLYLDLSTKPKTSHYVCKNFPSLYISETKIPGLECLSTVYVMCAALTVTLERFSRDKL